MGYALFTARKLSINARLNLCNAQVASNTERANALTNTIYSKQSKSAMDKATKTLEAQKAYTNAVKDLDSSADDYTSKQTAAQSKLDEALAEISKESAMTDMEIQGLNMQQTALDQQRKMLETQLNAYTNELETVGKAEEDAIKKSAPSFK